MDKENYYITVSREFASGGSEIASLLGAKLGIKCYDKYISEMTSVVTGFDKEIIKLSVNKAMNNFWYSGFLGSGSLSLYDKIFIEQSKVIKELAKRGSCIFVGRCADVALKDKENVIKVFITSPMSLRIDRACKRDGITPKEAEKLIKKNDKAREKYYRIYAGEKWGQANNYNICLSAEYGINKCVEILSDYIEKITSK
ncbi:MAG: cytidylate kinase-like family protein [Clostridia bacterium]|nr:cytidylate kinase-like family protein [Clostridia bacterium]